MVESRAAPFCGLLFLRPGGVSGIPLGFFPLRMSAAPPAGCSPDNNPADRVSSPARFVESLASSSRAFICSAGRVAHLSFPKYLLGGLPFRVQKGGPLFAWVSSNFPKNRLILSKYYSTNSTECYMLRHVRSKQVRTVSPSFHYPATNSEQSFSIQLVFTYMHTLAPANYLL
jgi:hypothetical protein